jgi:hypothetical protein
MKAIPKRLLIHTVTLERTTRNRWGEEMVEDEQELTFVRIDPSGKIVRDKNNAEIQLAATLFYDCRNSRPRDVEFLVDDIIVFNGQKHKVQTIEALYDERKLHHYELGLINHA